VIPLWAKAVGGMALVAAAAGYGYRHGAQSVQRKWDAQKVIDQRAALDLRNADLLRASNAGIEYEAQRAAIARRATNPSPESVYALHATICPPAGALGKGLELGDVPIPAVWLDRLRGAGADY